MNRDHIPRRATPPPMKERPTLNELELAMDYHQEAKALFEQVREVHEATLSGQRKIAFALSVLLSPTNPDENFLEMSPVDLVNHIQGATSRFSSRDVLDIVVNLMTLALSSHEVIHIFIRYSTQMNCLDVSVYPLKTEVFEKDSRILSADIFLNSPNARSDLLVLEDSLIDLIAEARDLQQENAA